MRKRTDLTIRIRPPKGVKLGRISIQPDGQVALFDVEGKPVTGASMERSAQYARAKGPKIQSRVRVSDQLRRSVGSPSLPRSSPCSS